MIQTHMMDQHHIDNLSQELATNPHVIAAYLFGSQASKQAHKNSDLDIAIFAPQLTYPQYAKLKSKLQQLVDLDIDISLVNRQADPLFSHLVFNTAQILVDKNPPQRLEAETLLELKYFDQQHFRSTINQIVRDRLGVSHAN